MKLYQYAIIHIPKEDKDKKSEQKASILKEPTYVLAQDDSQAQILAARAIPETHLDRLDEVQLAVRPF